MTSRLPPERAPAALRLVQAWSVPKAGHADGQNEDAFALADGVFALADGATETAFARAFARHLVAAAVRGGPWNDALAQAQAAHASETASAADSLPWYAQQKQEEGAAAALLRVRAAGHALDVEAVGDACVLVAEGGAWRHAWPLASPEAFSHRPTLLRSATPSPLPLRTRIALRPGQHVALATDALAAFLLATGPAALPSDGVEPAAYVDEARRRGLRNDDTTLVLLAC